MTTSRFQGDLVFVVKDFLGNPHRVGIFDVYLTKAETGSETGRAFTIRNGHLIFPAPAEPRGEVDMGELVLVAHPAIDVAHALPDALVRGKEVVIIPAA